MKLFIVSYQKSGTHQIMPIFGAWRKDVVDRSGNNLVNLPERYNNGNTINYMGVYETSQALSIFPDIAFGHLTYLPEYAKIFRTSPTKVLFNIRDPRDVVVAEWFNAQRHVEEDRGGMPLWDFHDRFTGELLFEKEDPIAELIECAAVRWPQWLGWMDEDFVYTVKYEKLRLDTRNEIQRIFDFCSPLYDGSDIEGFIARAVPRKQNPTFRKGIPGEWRRVFTKKHKDMSNILLSPILERMGYEQI